jgi:hypothetical protein
MFKQLLLIGFLTSVTGSLVCVIANFIPAALICSIAALVFLAHLLHAEMNETLKKYLDDSKQLHVNLHLLTNACNKHQDITDTILVELFKNTFERTLTQKMLLDTIELMLTKDKKALNRFNTKLNECLKIMNNIENSIDVLDESPQLWLEAYQKLKDQLMSRTENDSTENTTEEATQPANAEPSLEPTTIEPTTVEPSIEPIPVEPGSEPATEPTTVEPGFLITPFNDDINIISRDK